MADVVGFEGANFIYEGQSPDVFDLPCFKDDKSVITAWRLTPAEKLKVLETGVVWVRLLSHQVPPMGVSGWPLVTVGGRDSKAEPVLPRAPRRVAT